MSITKRLKDFLDEKGVAYTQCTHRAAYTAQEIAAAQHVPGQEMAKTIVVNADQKSVLVVLPAVMKIDLTALARELPFRQVALASEEEFAQLFPDCELGAMSPFGNLYGIPVYVDKSLASDEEIVFNAGTHTETIRMKYKDYERLVGPKIIDAAVSLHAAGQE